ncbi:MAG TPA: hypothetical protein VG294_11560 [Solirubrobacteraceae bacterium]|nr:hypothetical protein [Solirubrobacteraceae bacterium]
MRRRRSRFALLVVTALAAAGCGSSSSPNAASVPTTTATTTTASVTTASPPTTTTPPPTTTASTQATTTSSTPTTTATPTTSTTTSTSTSTTPLPAAPAGLKAATGYSSYDNCQGVCTGSVPASLRRPLHLPSLGGGSACPVTRSAPGVTYAGPAVGAGPVYAAQPTPFAVTSFINSSWSGGRVSWVAAPGYTGPVLIRGGQVGGPGAVGFGEGHVPVDELQLLTASTSSSGEPPGAREWASFTRVRSPGCYAYQVDGTGFSEVITFSATG